MYNTVLGTSIAGERDVLLLRHIVRLDLRERLQGQRRASVDERSGRTYWTRHGSSTIFLHALHPPI